MVAPANTKKQGDEPLDCFDTTPMSGDEDDHQMSDDEGRDHPASTPGAKKTFLPTDSYEGELEVDLSAYDMYHTLNLNWPCLSFDFIPHATTTANSPQNQSLFPATCYFAAGSQAPTSSQNEISIIKLSNLHGTKASKVGNDTNPDKHMDDESSDEDSDDVDDDDPARLPQFQSRSIRHNAGINRLRMIKPPLSSTSSYTPVVAVWSEDASVSILDLSAHYASLDVASRHTLPPQKVTPLHRHTGHTSEGFALDWSPLTYGRLASGDMDGQIHLWNPSGNGSGWAVNTQGALKGHTASVEDIQWSPSEGDVLASASADASIAIWDIRKNTPALNWRAHSSDVNVISWNARIGYLIVSGGDDGHLCVWDMRMVSNNLSPVTESSGKVADFAWHKAPITSVEWCPHDEAVFAASGADHQTTIWDLSVEPDPENPDEDADQFGSIPPQLLFIHQGQQDVKELHWHPASPGFLMNTALSGFNYFKTISV